MRAIFGCKPSNPRLLPNYRGFVGYPSSSMYTSREYVDTVSPGKQAGAIASCCGAGLPTGLISSCQSSGVPAINKQFPPPKPTRVTFGQASEAPNQPSYLNPIYQPSSYQPPAPGGGLIPDIQWIHLPDTGVVIDFLVILDNPCDTIWISSASQLVTNRYCFIHFSPMNMGVGAPFMRGDENVIPILAANVASPIPGGGSAFGFVKLCSPISQFYFTRNTNAGGGSFLMTLGCSNSLELVTSA